MPVTEELPTRDECLNMLKEARCSESVIKHSQAVEKRAIKIAELAGADSLLVSRGALLHDMGRGRTHRIHHAVIGADMARELGLSEDIALIIERHIGAGLSPGDANKFDLPERNYIPQTLEEKIVAHADNLTKDHKKRPVGKVIAHFESLGYQDVAEKVRSLHEELSTLCKIDLDKV